MKFKIFIWFFFFVSALGHSQTIIVDYIFQHRFTLPKNKHIYEDQLVNYDAINAINFRLIHSNDVSTYFCPDDNVSIFQEDVVEEILQHIEKVKITDYTSVVYKNYRENQMLNREYILQTAYIINSNIFEYDWEFIEEEKEISGFKCKLAKTVDKYGFEVFAWYSPEISIPNGPLNYHKLPGLILEIHSDMFSIAFNGMKLINTTSNIDFNQDGELVSLDKFLEIYNENYGKLKLNKK